MMEDAGSLQANPPTMPSFELEQPDDYSQYLLYSATEIVAVLRSLIQKTALVSVHFDHGKAFFLTSLIDLQADKTHFIVDVGSDETLNARALRADKLIFSTVIDKLKVQFSVPQLTRTQHQGRPAFIAAVPDALLRLQRREYFRLATPLANPIHLRANLGGDDTVDIPLLDISGGGVGLMLGRTLSDRVRRGQILENCRIVLPEEGLLVATLCVRNLFDVETRSGMPYVRVGCEFIDLPASRLAAIQRYIIRVERERKARLSGLS